MWALRTKKLNTHYWWVASFSKFLLLFEMNNRRLPERNWHAGCGKCYFGNWTCQVVHHQHQHLEIDVFEEAWHASPYHQDFDSWDCWENETWLLPTLWQSCSGLLLLLCRCSWSLLGQHSLHFLPPRPCRSLCSSLIFHYLLQNSWSDHKFRSFCERVKRTLKQAAVLGMRASSNVGRICCYKWTAVIHLRGEEAPYP